MFLEIDPRLILSISAQITNTAKIKRMKRKELRKIEMRSLPDASKKQVFVS